MPAARILAVGLLAGALPAAAAAATLNRAAPLPPPRDAFTLDAPQWPENFRLHLSWSEAGSARLRWPGGSRLELPAGQTHDVAVEHPARGGAVVRVWVDGRLMRGPEQWSGVIADGPREFPQARVDLGGDFTAVTRFQTRGNGTLFSKCAPGSAWSPDAKALFLRGGRLVYDVGWVGAVSGGLQVDDGAEHVAALVVRDGEVNLWLDGQRVARGPGFARPDVGGHVLQIGRAAPDFGGDLRQGRVQSLHIWMRALPETEVAQIFAPGGAGASTPDFSEAMTSGRDGRPALEPAPGVTLVSGWVQPLERADHGALVAGWDEKTLAEGREIYASLCVVCHGTREQVGSLPTALRFAEGQFKNGSDPYSMYLTLTKGFGQMVPQGQYTTAQKYSVIQYIRETFVRPHNSRQYAAVTPEYLAALPRGLTVVEAEVTDQTPPPYQQMDFGPALFSTIQVAPQNIAQKGIAIRLNAGPGGVSRGRAWMLYEHDTMRVAAASTGRFLDWRGIAFDGSHGTHPGLAGERHWVNPDAPGWADPDGRWEDRRLRGRDGRPYGPLPRDWLRYEGLFRHENGLVLAARIGGARLLESPGWIDYGSTPVFLRTLQLDPDRNTAQRTWRTRVAPTSVNVMLAGDGRLGQDQGFWVAEFSGASRARLAISRADAPTLAALVATLTNRVDLAALTRGGQAQWAQEIVTYSEAGRADGPFVADTFPLPVENPWQSWMRPGGFDFTPDGAAAVVATWNGDIWRVDGLRAPAPAPLRWRRLASGLYQPLGVKYRGADLFVTCRDQLARLHDLNGDGEIDRIENFNSDHQVTEHFHEFAMGLQIDAAGNFYYAKSGRHALAAVVPHHGTLLRISADGARTDILATGFRAANGVCLNPDGSFFVTDQEGFWTPKNRINRVHEGGFYGNMFGYTAVTNTADDAMEPPMVWITNAKDRSPAELLWVPEKAWGNLGGALLNLSYGMGRVFAVPHEVVDGRWQGAVCELPLPAFPTGVMRGRFASDGALYACGLFAWAGNATGPGGFYRIRRSDQPAWVPVAVRARQGELQIRFTEPLDRASVRPESFGCKVWSLQRTASYGSRHLDEHPLPVRASTLAADGCTITLAIPDLAPTHSYELLVNVRGTNGMGVERSLHGTIHTLARKTSNP